MPGTCIGITPDRDRISSVSRSVPVGITCGGKR